MNEQDFWAMLTNEQLEQLEAYENAREAANERWAERQNEAILAGTDDYPTQEKIEMPDWLKDFYHKVEVAQANESGLYGGNPYINENFPF